MEHSRHISRHSCNGSSPVEMPQVVDWRRGGDSNPRYGLSPYNGLANHLTTSPLLAEKSGFSCDTAIIGTRIARLRRTARRFHRHATRHSRKQRARGWAKPDRGLYDASPCSALLHCNAARCNLSPSRPLVRAHAITPARRTLHLAVAARLYPVPRGTEHLPEGHCASAKPMARRQAGYSAVK
jgi:hypothetical protein